MGTGLAWNRGIRNCTLGVWNKHVENQVNFFLWTDLNWKLDKTVLLQRIQEWNNALNKYCHSAGLVGEERDRVIAQHAAIPCAPCGRARCKAFDTEAKEFRRCSRCKWIAYCGSACQKKDWTEHRKVCSELKTE